MTEKMSEPKGLGNDLLIEYAHYARDDREGRASWSVKPRVDPGYHGDPPDSWYVVNRIVAQHKAENKDFWNVVSRWYLGEKPVWLIQREINKPDWWIYSTLTWATNLVEREYLDITRNVA